MKAVCKICPRSCELEEGQTGFCGARKNRDGVIVCDNYGRLTALALDPVEKKPLARFYPGAGILSVGSYGCNLRCPFCQNSGISMPRGGNADTVEVSPEMLVQKALQFVGKGNIGVAYTYNEPLVGYEYVRDCASLVREAGMKNVVVTNGYIQEAPLKKLLPLIDAMNIDLKGFTPRFYNLVGGDLETVKNSIALAAAQCHLEVTTLIIPGENDTEQEMRALAGWLSSVDREIVLHVTRFFPRYKFSERTPTPVETVYRLANAAREYLQYVYEGNC